MEISLLHVLLLRFVDFTAREGLLTAFFPLAAWVAAHYTMRASRQGRCFHITYK